MAPSPRIQFRAVPPLDAELRSRTRYPDDTPALSDTAVDSLELYYALLAAELRATRLTRDEAISLCDVLHGVLVDVSWAYAGPAMLAADLEELPLSGDDPGTADPVAVALAERVRTWSRGQTLAVIDAVRRFWLADNRTDLDTALAEVGLLPRPRLER